MQMSLGLFGWLTGCLDVINCAEIIFYLREVPNGASLFFVNLFGALVEKV